MLHRFRPFRCGTLSHDQLGEIFATLDAQAFQRCFVAWMAALTKTPADVITIDGKTSRRRATVNFPDEIYRRLRSDWRDNYDLAAINSRK
ncbi:MAG: hypothetical protein ACRD59_09700 [Candidatus Acidiferrales bacterium]